VVQETARQPGAVAWYEVDAAALEEVADRVEYARRLGAPVEPRDGGVAVRVRASITHTIGGLRVDERGRVVGADGLWAAGADAGGSSTGGYASGLASALVLGLAAAEDAAS
jgi:fumarate reductase flavoprotein subunit